jgi:UDP-glucose 6-dehydrogenase
MKIKIYGFGWVGRAMKELFPNAAIHDPELGYVNEEKFDVAFVCVPTPLKDGKLDTSIVEEVVKNAKEDLIIIRSTVMPGTCDKFRYENVVFQPEYLGETVTHPLTDQKGRQFVILGGAPGDVQKVIELYQTVYNANTTFRQMTAYEAEIVKLTENRAIAFKVAQCQELYDVCQFAGVDYNNIREAVYHDDPRFNLWWTFVFPDKRGFNSKCIPKDVYGWCAWAESVGYAPELTKKLLEVNDKYINAAKF